MGGVIWQSLCFFLYCQYVSSVDIPSEKLACITFAKYAEYDCTGTELGTEKYTTYSEPGHSECKDVPDEKTGMTLFTTNNEYCDLSDTGPMLRQTWYLFDQQKDCTPFLGLQIFQLEQTFSADSCILGGKTKFVSCAAGSCDNSSLPDYTSSGETIANVTDDGNVPGNATGSDIQLGNVTGNTTEGGTLPPPPDKSLGKIKVLCSEKYIEKNNESDCLLVCEPGLCCFDDTDSCANNTDGCALYKGCDNVVLNTTGVIGNITGNTTEGGTSQGMTGNGTVDELSSAGNSTESEVLGGNGTGNTTEAPLPPDASLGKIKVLCSETYIQEHNESDCLSICARGECCFSSTETESCSINSEACALYDGCENLLLNATGSIGNETVMNANESVANETETQDMNSTESNSSTNDGFGATDMPNGTTSVTDNNTTSNVGNTSNLTDTNATSPAHTGNASSLGGNGTATGANSRPPMPDNVRGGPEVVCSPEFRKEHKNGICLKTCEPGACCFSEADSCSSNTEVCELYALCKPVLKASSRFLYFL